MPILAIIISMEEQEKAPRRRKLSKEDKKLADRIRALRLERNITQEELSGRLGFNLSYIAYVETYRSGVSLPTVFKLARLFGVEVKDLFEF